MSFWMWHILTMIVIVVNIYSFADDQNRYSEPEIDRYLPTTKNIKMSKLYHFSEKKRPVRYKAYLAEKIAQILTAIYIIIFITGRAFTGSFDFLLESIFGKYPLIIYPFPVVYLLGIRIYVMKKKHQNKNAHRP